MKLDARASLFLVVTALVASASCADDEGRAANDAATAGEKSSAGTGSGGVGGSDSGAKAGSTARDDDGQTQTAGSSSKPPQTAGADAGGTIPPDPDAGPSGHDAGTDANDCGLCAAYASPQMSGTVQLSELSALSGLAVSRQQPEIIFAHNDHDRAVVYALDLQGMQHARITLEGAAASDIEDIAAGPCDGATCVFLGDIGDNAQQRSEYAILRFAEPSVPSAPGATEMSADFERFAFQYEDGSHNAEGLMVGPDGSVYIVTKVAPGTGGAVTAGGPSSIYRLPLPLSSSEVAVATKIATLPIPEQGAAAASGAAAHPCGLGFLVRTYDQVYEFRAPSGGAFEDAFEVAPEIVAMPDEPQSEGIDYRADGRGFITSGEGSVAPIFVTDCE